MGFLVAALLALIPVFAVIKETSGQNS